MDKPTVVVYIKNPHNFMSADARERVTDLIQQATGGPRPDVVFRKRRVRREKISKVHHLAVAAE